MFDKKYFFVLIISNFLGLQYIYSMESIKNKFKNKFCAYRVAIETGDCKKVQEFIDDGRSVNETFYRFNDAPEALGIMNTHISRPKNDAELFSLKREMAYYSERYSTLDLASKYNRPEVIEVLFSQEEELDFLFVARSFFIALQNLRSPIINVLLKKIKLKSSDLSRFEDFIKLAGHNHKNIYDDKHNNILHIILKNFNYAIFKLYRKQFTDLLNKPNLLNQTPQDLLLEQFINVIKNKKYKSLKHLMINVGFSSIKDSNGDTLLHHAVKSGRLKSIKILLYFILMNEPELLFVKNKQGDSPIHLAVQVWDSEKEHYILKFLLKFAYKKK